MKMTFAQDQPEALDRALKIGQIIRRPQQLLWLQLIVGA
jgi:hypothetical protein